MIYFHFFNIEITTVVLISESDWRPRSTIFRRCIKSESSKLSHDYTIALEFYLNPHCVFE